MIPEPDKRPYGLNHFILIEDWFTYRMRIRKILGTYKPNEKRKNK